MLTSLRPPSTSSASESGERRTYPNCRTVELPLRDRASRFVLRELLPLHAPAVTRGCCDMKQAAELPTNCVLKPHILQSQAEHHFAHYSNLMRLH